MEKNPEKSVSGQGQGEEFFKEVSKPLSGGPIGKGGRKTGKKKKRKGGQKKKKLKGKWRSCGTTYSPKARQATIQFTWGEKSEKKGNREILLFRRKFGKVLTPPGGKRCHMKVPDGPFITHPKARPKRTCDGEKIAGLSGKGKKKHR